MSDVISARELFDLTGEVALVTGASSGLGWRFAEVLAAHGARVVLAARRVERLEELKARSSRAAGEAETVALDVAERDQIAGRLRRRRGRLRHGDAAGQQRRRVGRQAGPRHDARGLARRAEVNLDGVWFVAQEAARRMVAADRPGTIVNVASLLGFRVAPTLSAYCVAKAGVVQLTAALAVELARHAIRVNAIAPGYILTEINREFFASPKGEALIKTIPQRRIGEPADLDGTSAARLAARRRVHDRLHHRRRRRPDAFDA
jgi:NAD(P)-dependent dehydrogenase (short-subunit alcohol dehydrogenase family)